MSSISGKFHSLHAGEELLRQQSVEAIEKDSNLSDHASIIERTMDLLDFFARQHIGRDENEVTIQLLSIRLFNGLASAFKLLLSGYYQTAALQQRDILETIFLLDLFRTDRTAIEAWRKANKNTRIQRFSPKNVRKFLDDRDRHTEKKRDKTYDLFCELAGHATDRGFAMLAPRGLGAHCGPFFEFATLKAVLEEQGKLAIQAGEIVNLFLPAKTVEAMAVKINFMECHANWGKKHYGRDFNRPQINEMRALLAIIKNQQGKP